MVFTSLDIIFTKAASNNLFGSRFDNIAKEAKMIGFPDDVDIGYVFSNICTMIEAMKKTIQEST